jgi:hypothetical protein
MAKHAAGKPKKQGKIAAARLGGTPQEDAKARAQAKADYQAGMAAVKAERRAQRKAAKDARRAARKAAKEARRRRR